MVEAPNKLTVCDGELELDSAHGPLRGYLRRWQQKGRIPDGTPVCLVTREFLQELLKEHGMNECA